MKQFFLHMITDAAGRTEPKLIVAWIFVVVGIVRLFMGSGAVEFVVVEGFALTLLGITAVADHNIDMASIMSQSAEDEPEGSKEVVGFSDKTK